jgi:hypothetical protein
MGLYSPAINTVNVPYGREKQNCIKNATSQLYGYNRQSVSALLHCVYVIHLLVHVVSFFLIKSAKEIIKFRIHT